MKKKLLTSAAIASFLTAAGVVIPQTDIFAADTLNTPHPSTVPGAQPSNAPHPSTVPSEQPSTEPKPSAVGGGGNLLEVKDKKKVDSFADYWIEDINLDKNNILTIKTKDNARVADVHYIDEENLPEQFDAPGAHSLVPTQSNGNVYRFDANKMISGKDANKRFVLNEILLWGPKDNEEKHYVIRKWYDAKGKPESAEGYRGGIYLDYKDLHKYNNKTRVVGPKATVEREPKLPEVGDKDYVVYTDKSQVELNGTIKTTVKYKPGVKKYSDVLFNKYIGKTDDGELAFENNFGKLKAPFGFDDGKNNDDKGVNNLVSWHLMDKDGNDVFYLALKGVPVGHYHITQLFGLDLAKGNFDNADFSVVQGKSVYRTDKVEQPKVEQPKVEQPKVEQPKVEEPKAEKPKVEEPKVIKPVEPTFPKVELPEKTKNKILEQQVGNRRISVHFDSTKIPATYFSAEEVKDKDELAELTKELKAINPKYKLDSVYDLKLTDSLGNTIDSVGSMRTVTLTNTKGKSVVYYVYRDENNKLKLDKLITYSDGNGSIVKFDAKHFSKYALVEEQTDGKQPEGPRAPQPVKPEDNNWNPFAQGQKVKEGSTEVKSEAGEVATKPVSNRKEGKALPNTGLQTTSYGFIAAIVGLFGAVALRRKNR